MNVSRITPSRSTATRSHSSRISLIRCETYSTAMPSAAMRRTAASSVSVSAADRVEVGSSRMSSSGRRASARASTMRWRRLAGSVSTGASSGTSSPAAAAIARAAARVRARVTNRPGPRRASASRVRFSATETPNTTPSSMFWWTVSMPAFRASSGPARSRRRPRRRSSPVVGRVTPESTLISVDLPAPFAPTSPNTSPARISRVTSRSATVAPYRFDTPETATTGGPAGPAAGPAITTPGPRAPGPRPGW